MREDVATAIGGTLHRVRIHAKSHRYVVDALAPLVDLDARQFSVTARAIQHGIGRHLDARVARKWLSSHKDPVSASLAKHAAQRLRTEGRKSLKEAKLRITFAVRLSVSRS